MGRVCLFALAVFLILFALAAVTNIRFVYMDVMTGIAALVAGVLCISNAFYRTPL